jgi:hypothetical protein
LESKAVAVGQTKLLIELERWLLVAVLRPILVQLVALEWERLGTGLFVDGFSSGAKMNNRANPEGLTEQ